MRFMETRANPSASPGASRFFRYAAIHISCGKDNTQSGLGQKVQYRFERRMYRDEVSTRSTGLVGRISMKYASHGDTSEHVRAFRFAPSDYHPLGRLARCGVVKTIARSGNDTSAESSMRLCRATAPATVRCSKTISTRLHCRS